MPTICKISLDATEYKRQLAEVVEQSRAAAAQISASGDGSTAGAVISVDTAQIDEAGRKVDELLAKDGESAAGVVISVDTAQVDEAGRKVDELFAKDGSTAGVAISVDTAQIDAANKKANVLLAKDGESVNITVKSDSAPLDDASQGLKKLSGSSNGASGGLKKLSDAFRSMRSAARIATVAIAAVAAIIKLLHKAWQDNINQLSDMHHGNAESIADTARQYDAMAKRTDAAMSSLGQLASAEKLSNVQKAEAIRLIAELNKGYRGLGVQLDSTTGRIVGYDKAMVEKLEKDKGRRLQYIEAEMRGYQAEIEEQQKIINNPWNLSFDSINQAKRRINDLQREKAKLADEKSALGQSTPGEDFRRQRQARLKDLRETNRTAQRERSEKNLDAAAVRMTQNGSYAAALALRNAQYNEAVKKVAAQRKKVDRAHEQWRQSSGDDAGREALINYEMEKKKLKELQDQRRAANREAALVEQRYADSFGNGRKMAQKLAEEEFTQRQPKPSQPGEEGFNSQKYIRHQRILSKISELAGMEWDLAHDRSRDLAGRADLSIKTNALTSRGGFRGGAAAPDADKWDRLNHELHKLELGRLNKIGGLVQKIYELGGYNVTE